jgi:hypothetical protein
VNRIKELVFVMETQCVFCETETEFLKCVYSNMELQTGESDRAMVVSKWREKSMG